MNLPIEDINALVLQDLQNVGSAGIFDNINLINRPNVEITDLNYLHKMFWTVTAKAVQKICRIPYRMKLDTLQTKAHNRLIPKQITGKPAVASGSIWGFSQ